MKRHLKAVPPAPQEPDRDTDALRRLDELGDVLTIADLAPVLHRSIRWIEQGLADGTFPIPTLRSLQRGRRRARLWSNADVRHFIERDATTFHARRKVS